MLDPLAKRLVIPQRPPNTESKVAGVRVNKTRRNATITTMAMNQRQFIRTHLPSLLQNIAKNSVEHDFSWMVAVKVDLHLFPPGSLGLEANRASSGRAGLPAIYSFFHGLGLGFLYQRFSSLDSTLSVDPGNTVPLIGD
jgi:hypothetical protein